MFSRHLYCRATETTNQYSLMLLSDEELQFLEKSNIPFSKIYTSENNDSYEVDIGEIRQKFCNVY